uniref:IS6 family transposase n=1 Tax=Brugia timori TaxID=42155 RepID=A0A0R3R9M0_9BILA
LIFSNKYRMRNWQQSYQSTMLKELQDFAFVC